MKKDQRTVTPGSLRVVNTTSSTIYSIVVSVSRSVSLIDSWNVTTYREFGQLITRSYATRDIADVSATFEIEE